MSERADAVNPASQGGAGNGQDPLADAAAHKPRCTHREVHPIRECVDCGAYRRSYAGRGETCDPCRNGKGAVVIDFIRPGSRRFARAEKVERITKEVEAGTYVVDLPRVAAAVLPYLVASNRIEPDAGRRAA